MAGVPVASPLIGRQAEQVLVQRALEAAKKGRGGTLIISGATGSGKTRLVDLVVDRAASLGFQVFRGNAAEGDVLPYSAFRRALPGEERSRSRARGSGSRSRDGLRPSFAGGPSPPLGPATLEPTARAVGSRVGAGSEWGGMALGELLAPTEDREVKLEELPPLGAAYRLLEQFEEASDSLPFVIALESFHWADPGSLAALRPLAREARRRPLLLAVSFELDETPSEEDRPEVENIARALQRESGAIRILLKGLPDAEARQLVESILQAPLLLDKEGDLPPVLTRTEGNPFLLQEVVRAGVRDGWIVRRGDGYRILEPTHDLQVPALLRWWVHRRISALLPNDLSLLEAISVLGSEFDPRALPTLLPEQAANLKKGLERLERRHGLVHPVRPSLWKVEPTFLASVIRSEMSGELRRRLHRRAGEWQAAHDPGAVERIAAHYVQAGEASLALPWIERAWQAASDRSDYEAAIRFCRWGGEMARTGNRPEEDIHWRVREARFLLQLGEAQRAQKMLQDAMAVAPEGFPRVLLRIELAPVELHAGHAERAFQLLEEAAAEPVGLGDAELAKVRIQAMRVDLYARNRQWDRVIEEAAKLLQHSEKLDERRRCRALNAYGAALTEYSRFAEAREVHLEALSRARKAGLVAAESNARSSLGILAVNMGDLAVSRAIFEQASAEWDRRGGLTNQAINTGNAAEVMLTQGDLETARVWVEQAFAVAERCGLAHLRVELTPLLARCYLEQGELGKGLELLAPLAKDPSITPGNDTYRELHTSLALEHLARHENELAWKEAQVAGRESQGLVGALSARTYALCQAAVGQTAKAEELLLSLVEEGGRLGRKMDRALALEALGDLYQAQGRSSEARVRWDESLGLMRACGALARAARLDEKRRRGLSPSAGPASLYEI